MRTKIFWPIFGLKAEVGNKSRMNKRPYKGLVIIYVGGGGGGEIFFVLAWKKKRDPPV